MNKPAIDLVTLQDGESANIVSENIEQLKSIFPEAFGEGGINFDTLRQLLGDAGIVDEGEEKYGLNWHGKKKARQIALTPSTGTLLPCPKESVAWDTTKNLFIEGDNLEALKLLQKSYAGKVKMIYIDPPYNTGKEFIYPDRFQDNLDTYLKYTGQVNDEGVKFSSDVEVSGRKHTNWLNMMFPRLCAARNLLRDDGVIMISIDEKESLNLRMICDQVFGEENFIAQFSVVTNYKGRNDKTNVAMAHEYIIAYKKASFVSGGLPLTASQIAEYKLIDFDGKKYKLRDLRKRGGPDSRSDRPKMWFPLYLSLKTQKLSIERLSEDDIEITPKRIDGSDGRWRWGKERVIDNLDNLEASYVKRNEKWNISYRIYLQAATSTPIEGDDDLEEDEDDFSSNGSIPKSVWMGGEFSTDAGKRAFKKLIPSAPLEYPKSVELLKRCIYYGTNADDIVLDFFLGSGTLAQALYEVELEQPKGRRFIGIQLPEKCENNAAALKGGYKTVAEIAMDRIRRAAEEIKKSNPHYNGDLGFKAFRLANSNIKLWSPDRKDLEQTLLSHQEHLVEGRTEQDILYELLIKRGIDLAVPIESRNVSGKEIYSIGYGVLFACLNESIAQADVENVAQGILKWYGELSPSSDTHVFFRDSAFSDDIAKTNMAAILEQNGITHVRSL